jgi:hypothetical protein
VNVPVCVHLRVCVCVHCVCVRDDVFLMPFNAFIYVSCFSNLSGCVAECLLLSTSTVRHLAGFDANTLG